MSAAADYVVQLRVKNGPMLRAMRRAGYATAADLCRATGVTNTELGRYLNLRMAPILACGDWRPGVVKIAEALNTMPEDLFPAQHIRRAFDRNTAEFEMSIDDIAALPGSVQAMLEHRTPEDAAIGDDLRRALIGSLGTLKDRDRAVIEARFGLYGPAETYRQIAARISTTPERVRQIENRALRRLRHQSSAIHRHTEGGKDVA